MRHCDPLWYTPRAPKQCLTDDEEANYTLVRVGYVELTIQRSVLV